MKQKPIPIYFHNVFGPFFLPNRNALKIFIKNIFKNERVALDQLNYIFCSDDYLLNINLQYLKHNTYTDIVTFPLSDTSAPIIGEIYISIERIRENALLYNQTFTHELHRVIFHGALHLCGYSDKSINKQKVMRTKEDFYLAKYFVPRETK